MAACSVGKWPRTARRNRAFSDSKLSCQAAAVEGVELARARSSASFHIRRMMTLASCRLWARQRHHPADVERRRRPRTRQLHPLNGGRLTRELRVDDLDQPRPRPQRQTLAGRADGAALVRSRHGRGIQAVPPRERPPAPARSPSLARAACRRRTRTPLCWTPLTDAHRTPTEIPRNSGHPAPILTADRLVSLVNPANDLHASPRIEDRDRPSRRDTRSDPYRPGGTPRGPIPRPPRQGPHPVPGAAPVHRALMARGGTCHGRRARRTGTRERPVDVEIRVRAGRTRLRQARRRSPRRAPEDRVADRIWPPSAAAGPRGP